MTRADLQIAKIKMFLDGELLPAVGVDVTTPEPHTLTIDGPVGDPSYLVVKDMDGLLKLPVGRHSIRLEFGDGTSRESLVDVRQVDGESRMYRVPDGLVDNPSQLP